MGGFPHGRPRERLTDYLQSFYTSVGAMSYDLGLSRKQAENLLVGCHWPNDLTLARIVQRFGKDLLDAVFAPEIDPVVARLEGEERQLERQLQAIRARKRQVEGRALGDPHAAEAAETAPLALGDSRPDLPAADVALGLYDMGEDDV